MMIATDNNCDGNDVVKQFASASSATMVCKKDFFFLLFSFFFLIILFFASSTDLVTYSFDHSCRELAEMEIKK
jgi:hypothetical protein